MSAVSDLYEATPPPIFQAPILSQEDEEVGIYTGESTYHGDNIILSTDSEEDAGDK